MTRLEFTMKAIRENNSDDMKELLFAGQGQDFEVGKMKRSN